MVAVIQTKGQMISSHCHLCKKKMSFDFLLIWKLGLCFCKETRYDPSSTHGGSRERMRTFQNRVENSSRGAVASSGECRFVLQLPWGSSDLKRRHENRRYHCRVCGWKKNILYDIPTSHLLHSLSVVHVRVSVVHFDLSPAKKCMNIFSLRSCL